MAYAINEAKRIVIDAGLRLVEAGLIARTWGNISARISDTQFVITPSGKAYDALTPDDIVAVNIADCSYEGNVKPSSEKGVHAAGYALRPDVDFIIHTHQSAATAVGTLGKNVAEYDGEDRKVLGDAIVCGEYAISSTKKLAKKMRQAIGANPRSNAFFMRYHGFLALGTDVENAFDIASRAERICQKKVEDTLGKDEATASELTPDASLVRAIGKKGVVFTATPAVLAVSRSGRRIKPMIDDMAQIGGTDIPCVRSLAEEQAIASYLAKRGAVLVMGLGAVCAAEEEDDAQAIAQVLEKNCQAKRFCEAYGKNHHIGYFDALLQRLVYVKKYSKLK